MSVTVKSEGLKSSQIPPLKALVDLIIFLTVMFFVRTIYLESLGFWGNALFKTVSTVGVASILLYARKQSWRHLGLVKPKKCLRILAIVAITLVGTVSTIMLFEIFLRDLFVSVSQAETSSSSNVRFPDLEEGVTYFFSILLFVWIESMLEELQDRGFSLNRFESLFSKTSLATLLAVFFQAAIFGFRHSYDLSPRSATTGLIGLVFGIVYVLTGRNLWPLIIAHIILNTMSMVERL